MGAQEQQGHLPLFRTKKVSYRKNDRAMRPTYAYMSAVKIS